MRALAAPSQLTAGWTLAQVPQARSLGCSMLRKNCLSSRRPSRCSAKLSGTTERMGTVIAMPLQIAATATPTAATATRTTVTIQTAMPTLMQTVAQTAPPMTDVRSPLVDSAPALYPGRGVLCYTVGVSAAPLEKANRKIWRTLPFPDRVFKRVFLRDFWVIQSSWDAINLNNIM
ncbi:hypothetical protein B0H12DRAFT_97981 [Mycena haematopus]|nr:hypothetical protein B0H12DRAFT_97981 [Mycena haematopus]